jgi:hypothetical protein
MSDWLKVFGETSLDNLFVIAGLAFLGIGIVGKITGKIEPGPRARGISAIVGVSLVLSGIWIHRGHVSAPGATAPPQSAIVIPPAIKEVHAQGTPSVAQSGTDDHSPANPPRARGLSYFSGTWKNNDARTRGLTTVRVRTAGESVWVRAWGACHPTDCDWGEVSGTAFAPTVSADPANDAQKVTAVFQTSFSNTLMTLSPADGDGLEADTQTRFTDNSGRSSYSATYTFRH